MAAYTLMLVEDDQTLCAALAQRLEEAGFGVVCAQDFSDVLGCFVREKPQLVLLDIGLPIYNGFYWCAQIRALSKVPILFLSAAADNMNIVLAVQMGGDDFVAKPFSVEVLLAKVRALLRRCYDFKADEALLASGGVVLKLAEGCLSWDGGSVELTRNEMKILKTLMQRPSAFVPKETIMQALWESESFIDANTLSVNINRLRKKLEEAGLTGFIRTKKGVGYAAGEG